MNNYLANLFPWYLIYSYSTVTQWMAEGNDVFGKFDNRRVLTLKTACCIVMDWHQTLSSALEGEKVIFLFIHEQEDHMDQEDHTVE